MQIGTLVRVLDKDSDYFNQIGKVTEPWASDEFIYVEFDFFGYSFYPIEDLEVVFTI